ncbi:MAG: hypothetical protein COA71_09740 [SAR86 cluster bacterium]|uniref:Cytochrome c domain-containing protein n=1 Tax=SAR86 cluster bacterium TaxID=2030880 RepID=A0A2A5CBZ3_9GAMM|nr:MAG: hypothetical protein COA71_09740 [SAR86 cluster bacterium]
MKKFKQAALLVLFILPAFAAAQFPYERDYPAINYADSVSNDAASLLFADIAAGRVELEHRGERGYLESLLTLLNIDDSSQLLVFSKTARKSRFVSPATPRALYFNDEVYIGYIPDTNTLEIAAMDPILGPVFFDIPQDVERPMSLNRETSRCLRCHDSMSNTGGGTPRFMMGSRLVDSNGAIASHEVSVIMQDSTPLNRRWGGWYVTGLHGEQETMGNLMFEGRATSIREIDLLENGNRTDLSEWLDTSPYLNGHSDIVALLVLQHQIEVQNTMTRATWDYRQLLAENGAEEEAVSAEKVAELAKPVLDALFMTNEAPLGDQIQGLSGFTEYFQNLGPFDNNRRSLRDLDLNARVFKYPLSYLIYTDSFAAMPEALHTYLIETMYQVLSADEDNTDYAHLDAEIRAAILDIVNVTAPGFFL